jgi:hypothetical protein
MFRKIQNRHTSGPRSAGITFAGDCVVAEGTGTATVSGRSSLWPAASAD